MFTFIGVLFEKISGFLKIVLTDDTVFWKKFSVGLNSEKSRSLLVSNALHRSVGTSFIGYLISFAMSSPITKPIISAC